MTETQPVDAKSTVPSDSSQPLPPPRSAGAKTNQNKLAPIEKFFAALKTDKKTQIATTALAVLLIAITTAAILLSQSQSQVKYIEPQINPQQSPEPKESQYATHPLIIETEAKIATAQAQLENLQITNHPLLPPTLDLKISLDK